MQHLPPNLESRLYGPQRIAAVVAVLAEDGIAPALALADSGVAEADLQDLATRVSYKQVATVFRNATRSAKDPATAFRAGRRMHLTAYGMYGYGLLSSPTFAAEHEFGMKYSETMGPVASPVAFSYEGEACVYTYEVWLTPDPADPLYRFALEFAYAAHLTFGRDLYGSSFNMLSMHVSYREPAYASIYSAMFGCPVHFDARSNKVLIDKARFSFANRIPDTITHGAVREVCQQMLIDGSHAGGTATIVRRTLVEQMPWRFPTIEPMASALGMHSRTLRRRLESEGATFKDLLTDVRRRLAIEYLRRTRMTSEEISIRLGYSDAANFRHAFKRWTGKTPQAYRQY